MAICKYCNIPFQWGRVEERWVPLVPVGDEEGLERGYQDEDGNLRAAHRLVCLNHGGGAIRATRLPRPVPASALIGAWSTPDPDTGEVKPVAEEPRPLPFSIKRKNKKRKPEPSPCGDDDSIPFA